MPIPKRKPGEPEQEFISSCIKKLIDEYDQDQAVAICYQQLDIQLSFDPEWRKWFMNTKNTSAWNKK